MKKIILALTILLAICLTVCAVSAGDDGWSFNFSTEESSSVSTNGGEIEYDDGNLSIQGFDFKIPDGYKENESAEKVGEDANQSAFPGYSMSVAEFDKGNESIIIKVVYGDDDLDNDTYEPLSDSVAEKIGDTDGYMLEYDDGVTFTYLEDGKLVEIFASEDALIDLIMGEE